MRREAPSESSRSAPSPVLDAWERSRGWASEHPRAAAALVYGAIAFGAAIAAYFTLFTVFVAYDDEGTLLVTLDAFSSGDALYRDVYTPYGPFYYELFGGLAALTGVPVTTNASRLTVLVVWLATSGIYGLAVQRLTGRLLLGAAGMLAAFAVLRVLVPEPMHPHGLASLLLAALVLVVVSAPSRRIALSGALAGALIGALLMTKINLGIFAIAAAVFAAAFAYEPLYRLRALRWLVALAFLAMPLAVATRDLGEVGIREFVVVVTLAALALLLAASARRAGRSREDGPFGDWLIAGVAGAVVSVTAILLALLLTGPTPADVYDGLVDQALRIRDAVVNPLPLPLAAIDWGIAAVAAALVVAILPRRGGAPSPWPGLARILAGLTIWLAVASALPFNLDSQSLREALPLSLAWIAAIPPAGAEEPPFKRFARIFLPALAIAQALQIYPVAGSQIGIAGATMVPVGALCIADGLPGLRDWARSGGTDRAWRLSVIATVAVLAVAGKLAYDSIARPIAANAPTYRNQPALSLPGAGLVHIDEGQARSYEALVELLRENRCTTFFGMPSFNSFYLWSSLEAPKPQIPGPWVRLLEDSTQQRIVDQLEASPRPCAIHSPSAEQQWLGGEPRPETPLTSYFEREFEPAAEVGEFQFLLPRGG